MTSPYTTPLSTRTWIGAPDIFIPPAPEPAQQHGPRFCAAKSAVPRTWSPVAQLLSTFAPAITMVCGSPRTITLSTTPSQKELLAVRVALASVRNCRLHSWRRQNDRCPSGPGLLTRVIPQLVMNVPTVRFQRQSRTLFNSTVKSTFPRSTPVLDVATSSISRQNGSSTI
jgi:hypothetical protein